MSTRSMPKGKGVAKKKSDHVDLMLAILCTKEYQLPYGYGLSQTQIALFCDVKKQAIQHIEYRALRKVRRYFLNHPELMEEIQAYFRRLHPKVEA